jgi:predicted phage terminase large subunit-like protein
MFAAARLDRDRAGFADQDLVSHIHAAPETVQIEIDRNLVKRFGLRAFTPLAWHTIEGIEYQQNWHLDAIAEHLQAVIMGQITRLIIMVPPRHMKSTSLAIMAPAYSWTIKPHLKWLFASYAFNLSIRDSRKCRRVLTSTWYQRRWGDKFKFVHDQNTKIRFENDKQGYRLATSVDGQLTGEGGDIIAVDDPHNVREAESEATREATLAWWRESMSSRLNDPKRGAFILSQQRVHVRDLAGDAMAREQGWTVLCLPARYESNHPQVYAFDPRKTDGELLWPERYGEKELTRLETALGAYAAAAQLQQRPSPREGGHFKRHWFDPWHGPLPGDMEWVRGLDLAASKKKITKADPDYSASVLIGWSPRAKYWIIAHAERYRESPGERNKRILHRAERDAAEFGYVHIEVPQDPGSGGVEQAQSIVRMLAGFSVRAEPVTGDKVTRADPIAGQAQNGNVRYLPDDPARGRVWNDEFFGELTSFPTGAHDDYVDALSIAFNKLTGGRSGLLDFYAGQIIERRAQEAREKAEREALRSKGVTVIERQGITDLGAIYFKDGRPPEAEDDPADEDDEP